MRINLLKLGKYCWLAMAIVLVIVAIFINVARLMFAHVGDYNENVEKWASQALHYPLKIKKIHATFHGLQPVFKLRDVTVYNEKKTKVIAHVAKLNIGVDLVSSLFKHHWMSGELLLSGLKLTLRQNADGRILINGVPTGDQRHLGDMQFEDVLEWLLTPGNKTVNRLQLTWKDQAGRELQFHDIDLNLKSGVSKHSLVVHFHEHKTSAKLVAVIDGSVLTKSLLKGKLYLNIKQLALGEWLKDNVAGFNVKRGMVSGGLWLNWHGRSVDKIQSQLQLTQLQLLQPTDKKIIALPNWEGQIAWLKNRDGWELLTDQVNIKHNNKVAETSIKYRGIELGILRQLLLSNADITSNVIKQLNEVSTEGVFSGQLLLDKHSGRLQFSSHSQSVFIDAPKAFNSKVKLQRVNGFVNWYYQPDGIHFDFPVLSIQAEDLAINAVGRIFAAKNDSPRVDILAGYRLSKIQKISRYLPERIMKPKLVHWLKRAIHTGDLKHGQLLLRGEFNKFPYDHAEGRFVARSIVEGLNLKYQPVWPEIDDIQGDLTFDNRSMHIQIYQAQMDKKPIESVIADIDDLANSYLTLQGVMRSTGEYGMQFINHSPLKNTLGRELNLLNLKGRLVLDLKLGMLLGKKDPMKVLGTIHWTDASIDMPSWNMMAEQLNGDVTFTEHDINADHLTATLFNQPVKLNLATLTPKDSQYSVTQVDMSAMLNAQCLSETCSLPVLKNLTGITPVFARLLLHRVNDNKPNVLTIKSDLVGVDSRLPLPFTKSISQKKPLNLRLQFGAGESSMTLDYDDNVYAKLDLAKGQPINLSSHLNQFNWDNWQDILLQQFKSGNHNNRNIIFNAKVNNLMLLGQTLHNATIKLSVNKDSNQLDIQSDKISGVITVPHDFPQQALQAEFSQLVIRDPLPVTPSSLIPEDIPPLNIDVEDFYYKGLALGHAKLSITPDAKLLHINQLSIVSNLMQLNATGTWRQLNDYQQTTLNGTLYTGNLGVLLNQFDMNDNLVGGVGHVGFTLAWFDSLLKPSVDKLNGKIKLRFQDGQIVKLSQEAREKVGLGRVLNLFSLQSLQRRLKFDFSDLTKTGFVFDQMYGDFVMRDGNAYTDGAFMQGPVAKVSVHGRLGLTHKDYALMLAITPHVTSSLPVVATLAGGPVAGAATWLADKLISKAVTNVTTVNYRVLGPWNHPQVDHVVEKLHT